MTVVLREQLNFRSAVIRSKRSSCYIIVQSHFQNLKIRPVEIIYVLKIRRCVSLAVAVDFSHRPILKYRRKKP